MTKAEHTLMTNPKLSSEIECKVCGQKFKSYRGLHGHLKKHKLSLAEYYCVYYPRFDLWDKSPIPFKNKNDYF